MHLSRFDLAVKAIDAFFCDRTPDTTPEDFFEKLTQLKEHIGILMSATNKNISAKDGQKQQSKQVPTAIDHWRTVRSLHQSLEGFLQMLEINGISLDQTNSTLGGFKTFSQLADHYLAVDRKSLEEERSALLAPTESWGQHGT